MRLETSQLDNATFDDDVEAVIARLSLQQKLAQLVGLWAGARPDDDVAPMQEQLLADRGRMEAVSTHGLGQLTRHWGTTPLAVPDGLAELRERQKTLTERVGIRAIVHEECLTGVLAWGATAYPTPLAWGATFDPHLVERMAQRIGSDLRALGVHQGLAPVLDVVRDARWGRVEECIAEDPLLVGSLGSAYVRGLEGHGVVATLKHFVGYSASRAGRNHAPVSVGHRELVDVFFPPFERAVRAGARSVMNSYADVDGVPAGASEHLLTDVLRDDWGFEGTVVADYFAVTFLQTMHRVADSPEVAARLALSAGIDVELPTGSAFLEPLEQAVRSGAVDEALVDRALRRVLRQKRDLGLLDAAGPEGDIDIDLDSVQNREIAEQVAAASIVLLHNDGTLPLDAARTPRMAVIGPNADRFGAMFGCYSFVKHVLPRHPDVPPAIEAPTVAESLRGMWQGEAVTLIGCEVDGVDVSGIAEAVATARSADVVIAVLGDDSGMFGRGTSGEGCDRENLSLPGVQPLLLAELIATGTPVVLVLVTGRPYELPAEADGCAAIVQAFFPGQAGGPAIADVLLGHANPGGRLPVQFPAPGSAQPASYLHPALGARTEVSSADPTPRYPFGYGLSYTRFTHGLLSTSTSVVGPDDTIVLEVTVRNDGEQRGDDVLQLYASDPVAQVVRPLRQLVAYRRVSLEPGEEQHWIIRLPVAALAFAGLKGRRIIEPGQVTLTMAPDAGAAGTSVEIDIVGVETEVRTIADEAEWTLSGSSSR